MRLGYNTNGFAHHRLSDAVEIIAELGYRSIGLTLDVHHLEILLDEIDRRQELIALQAVKVKFIRRKVGGGDQYDALLEKAFEKAAH